MNNSGCNPKKGCNPEKGRNTGIGRSEPPQLQPRSG